MTTLQDLRGRTMGGGDTRPVANIRNIARHHSATTSGDVFAFENSWKAMGWHTGGYHEIILRDGTVQICYNDNVITNGVLGHNPTTYHICLVGNGSFTEAQERAFEERARLAMERFNLSVDQVLGHNEFSGNATACPGTNMNQVRERLRVTVQPPAPAVPVIKIINLWDYTGAKWLPEIQQSYVGVVALDRVFGVNLGSSWRARMIHVNYEQAVVITRELRLVYPNYEIYGARINVNDVIAPTTPFAVVVDGVPQSEIDNVIRHLRNSYAGIITADRIFLTPQPGTNPAQVTLEIHNFQESQRETIINQLKERYGISDSQFQ